MKYTKDEFKRVEAKTMAKITDELGDILTGSTGFAIMLVIMNAFSNLAEILFEDSEEVEIVSDKEQ